MPRSLLHHNASVFDAATRQDIDGEEHLVLPVIALKEGVLNDVFYSRNEIETFAMAWNGVPVPVSHPKAHGHNISANSPEQEAKTNIGKFYNVKYEDGKLKGEIWINIAKAERLGHKEIVNKLESGQMMEVSTGLFSEIEQKSGSYESKPYNLVATNIRPDHLALLPNEEGACSVEDGCGVPRTNENSSGGCGCGGDDSKSAGIVERLTNAIISAFSTNKEANAMTKKELVEALIANADTDYQESDRETLTGLSEDLLKKMQPAVNEDAGSEADNDDGSEQTGEAAAAEGTQTPTANAASQLSADERVQFNRLVANEQSRVVKLRKAVVDGYAHLTEEMVANMSVEHVETLAGNIRPSADYSAQAGFGLAANEESYEPPSILLAANETETQGDAANG